MSVSEAGRTALAAYAHAPLSDRLHTRVRWHTCPFPELERHVPTQGRILDVGCGHGLFPLYLSVTSAGRKVTGTDVDADKLAIAREAASSIDVAARFQTSVASQPPEGPWDAVTIVDVLYLLGRASALELVRSCAAALAPGGRLIVKEIDVEPRWKHRLAALQEMAATRLLHITVGADVSFVPPADIVAVMRECGLEVRRHRLDQGRLHPHHLMVGHRSPDAASHT